MKRESWVRGEAKKYFSPRLAGSFFFSLHSRQTIRKIGTARSLVDRGKMWLI